MTSRHLIDPDLLPALELLPKFDFEREAMEDIRRNLLAVLVQEPPEDDGVTVTERMIPGRGDDDPAVRVFVYDANPGATGRPAVLHIHSGGYVMGSPMVIDGRNRLLARELGCVVVSVQYRLAPEHPYPAAFDDIYAALLWVHGQYRELGIDPARIAVAGESAGGGLAASLAQMARDRGEVSLLIQVLTYPTLDDRTGRSIDRGPYAGEFVWKAGDNRFGWSALLGNDTPEDPARHPYAAPGRHEDLTGLAPAFITVGALDLLAEEDIDYARRLMRAGVPVELHVFPGAFHGFDAMPDLWSAQQSLALTASALRRAFERDQSTR